jgi:phosphonate transport system substrate-binding protein
MKSSVRVRGVLLAVASLALFAGCGDDGDDAGAEAAPAESTSAPETTAAAVTAAETTAAAETTDTTAAETSAADTTAAAMDDTADWPEKLVLGAVPSEESTALEESYSKLIAVLETELGLEVEFFQASDYAGIIEAQISGEVDLAQYGPFAYVIAKNNGADIAPIGALVDGPDEQPGYQSYGIARADNAEINALADFAGKNVCFVDPSSTSGYLYPSAGLLAEGIDPESGVAPVFAGGHDASVLSVKNGDCDAGFAFDAMVDSVLIESGDIAEGEIKTVWKSEVIAGSPIAVRLDLPESLVEAITTVVLEQANQDALIEAGICDDPETCGLTDENAWGWVAVDDSLYDGVRAVCEQTKSARCEG